MSTFKVGDVVEYVQVKRTGRTVNIETKTGKALDFRTVKQVLVISHGKKSWVDISEVKTRAGK